MNRRYSIADVLIPIEQLLELPFGPFHVVVPLNVLRQPQTGIYSCTIFERRSAKLRIQFGALTPSSLVVCRPKSACCNSIPQPWHLPIQLAPFPWKL